MIFEPTSRTLRRASDLEASAATALPAVGREWTCDHRRKTEAPASDSARLVSGTGHALLRVMRVAVLTLVAALAGCFGSKANEFDPGGDDAGPTLGARCEDTSDCVAAGASCCGCAEYAVRADSDWAMACEDVECPPPQGGTCTGLEAQCIDQTCTLACAEITCDDTCETGFATDDAGCLSCTCAPTPRDPVCEDDADCARVPADCCGCDEGGADTAVPVGEVDEWLAGLGCDPEPVCPGVDVCEPGAVVVCTAAGQCALGGAALGGTPPNACGTPDLPPCPAGQSCVLNSDEEADMAGLGVCR
jgi:hypothetical protein